ncbi:MAG: hypothetical protein WCR49_01730 [Opitutae bacterium]
MKIRLCIGAILLGFACFVGLLVNEAHHSGEEMLLVFALTMTGCVLLGVGILGLLLIAIGHFWKKARKGKATKDLLPLQ